MFAGGVYYIHAAPCCAAGRDQVRYEVRFLEFASGRRKTLQEIEGSLNSGLSVSPDRRTFLFSKIVNEGADLMLIENFR